MLPALLAGTVGARFVQRLGARLPGECPQHGLGRGQRVFQERAQVARCPELDSEASPIVRTAFLCDQRMVGVVQVAMPGPVMGRRAKPPSMPDESLVVPSVDLKKIQLHRLIALQ